jgi:hypothetical protein
MKTIILSLFLFTSSAFASDLNLSVHNRYEALNNYFSLGRLPSEAEVTGKWSGRCYLQKNPNSPIGALILGMPSFSEPTDINGPLFPSQPIFILVLISNESFSPARFDNLTESDSRELANLINSSAFSKLTTRVENGSLVSDNVEGNLSFLARSYQNYLLMQSVVIKDSESLKKGDVYTSCYFFKKLN